MSWITSDFSSFRQERPPSGVEERNALSTVKKVRQCHRRKILNIRPLRMEQMQKEIEEAASHSSTAEKENINHSNLNTIQENTESTMQDSFDLDFAALSLHTPAKYSHARNNHFVTPSVAVKEAEHKFLTPNNSIPTKIQCSVKMQPYLRIPTTKVYTAPNEMDTSYNSKWKVQPSVDPRFGKLQVNGVEYIVLNELGKGGSSEVFHCFNYETKTHHGVKVVSLENGASASGFINEVNVLKTLQKCNRIIRMFDYEIKTRENILLVVLELGGKDLSKILKELAQNSSHMPLNTLLNYWMDMLYAVKQTHSHGIIHTDLKPANFLQVDGFLKLIDFGIAMTIQGDMTSAVKAVPEGSFNYISPEALNNESSSDVNSPSYGKPKYKISIKSDVWSLGCILYQLVYQRTPFQHITNMWHKLATIGNPNHKIAYPAAPWVPQRIIDTMKKCLQGNMKLRPSVDELISEYEGVFNSL